MEALSVEVLFTPDNYQEDLCVTVEIVDDSVLEELEYLQISLSTEDTCVDFKEQLASLGIADNDCECALVFLECSSSMKVALPG